MNNGSINEQLFAFVRPSRTSLAKQYIRQHGLAKIEDLSTETLSHLKTAIASNLSNKVGFLKATSGLGIDKQRLDLIFDNEVHEALEIGGLKYARTEGAATKTWEASGADNCCPDCEEMDGESVPLDSDFSNGCSVAHLHPGCNCETSYQK